MLRDRIDYQEFCRGGQLRGKSSSAGPSLVAARRALLGNSLPRTGKVLVSSGDELSDKILSDTIAGEMIVPFSRNGRSQLPLERALLFGFI